MLYVNKLDSTYEILGRGNNCVRLRSVFSMMIHNRVVIYYLLYIVLELKGFDDNSISLIESEHCVTERLNYTVTDYRNVH